MMKTILVSCLVSLAVVLLFWSDAGAQTMPLRFGSKGPLRSFKSDDGGFTVEARLVGHTETAAVLERKDGKEITVPLTRLSAPDRVYIADYITKEAFGAATTPAPATSPAQPSSDPSGPFDAKAVVKAWSAPDEPFKLTSLANWKLERMPDHFELSQDGETVYAAYFADAKHLLYRAKDGKLLQTIQYGSAPLTAAAISPDGKFLVATIGGEGAGVYDIAQKKQRFVHNAMVKVTRLAILDEKKPRVWGSFPSGSVANYPLLGGQGGTFEAPPVPPPARDTDATEMGVSTDGKYLVYRVPGDLKQFYVANFAGAAPKLATVPCDMSGGSSLAIGNRLLALTGVPDALMLIRLGDTVDAKFGQMAFSFRSTPDRQVSVAPDDSACAAYYPDRGHLTVFSLPSVGVKRYGFPRTAKPKWVRIHWKNNLIATCTPEGQVDVATMSGHKARLALIAADVQSWLQNKQDARIEQMATELEKEGLGFSFSPLVPKYATLENVLRTEILANPAATKLADEWRARNKTSRLARYYQAQQLVTEAWLARGGDFAGNVTPAQWNNFKEKMAKAEPVLASFDKDPVIPAPAYAVIFALARGQQWEADRVEKYVTRMMKECPDNIEGHCARVEVLMPRWGGAATACRDYADRVAKEVGGPAGDAVYAFIAFRLHKFHGPTVFTELQFDAARVHTGLAHHFRDNLDSPYYHQLGLLMGTLANDRNVILPYVKAMFESNEPHLPDVIQEEIYLQLAKGLNLDR